MTPRGQRLGRRCQSAETAAPSMPHERLKSAERGASEFLTLMKERGEPERCGEDSGGGGGDNESEVFQTKPVPNAMPGGNE